MRRSTRRRRTLRCGVVTRGHRPQRTCLGCNARDEQSRLIRLTVTAAGDLRIDPEGQGRGGYLHRRQECWRLFLRRKSVFRAFRVEIDRRAKESLLAELADGCKEPQAE